jgi:son of sevenless-like protein
MQMTYYLERLLVETGNLQERVALMSRMIEIMIVFEELQNYNGVMEFFSALNSSSCYRLEQTRGVRMRGTSMAMCLVLFRN